MGIANRGLLCLAGAVTGGLMLAGAAAWQGKPPATAPAMGTHAPRPAASQIFIDPQTGALGGPSTEQAAALAITGADATSRSDKGLVIRKSVHGGETVHLMGRFQNTAIATTSAHGVQTDCVAGAAHGHAAAAAQ